VFLGSGVYGVRWVAPFCLTRNVTKVGYFFSHIGIVSPKILMHADESLMRDLMTSYPSRKNEKLITSTSCPKLLEVYDETLIPQAKDANEHIITGKKRLNGSLTQRQQVVLIKDKIKMLGKQKNMVIWCYADYPDSSPEEDLGLVQIPDETLPLAEIWKYIDELTSQIILPLFMIVTLSAVIIHRKTCSV